MSDHDDFAFEPVRGLPKALPDGETILWQGAPDWRTLARRAFHARKLAVYFGVLLAWFAATADGYSSGELAVAMAQLGALSVAAVSIVCLYAYTVERTTVFTLTQRRLVIRTGVALPITLNIPYALVEKAALKPNGDGTGDILLTLVPGERVAYMVLWPHARPWHFARVEPCLRSIPDAETVARTLARAVVADSAARGQPVRAGVSVPERAAPSAGGQLSGSAA